MIIVSLLIEERHLIATLFSVRVFRRLGLVSPLGRKLPRSDSHLLLG